MRDAMKPTPYVYKITNLVSGEFYFGSRYANVRHKRTAQDDLWNYYRSSSKVLKQSIENFGEHSFKAEIIFLNDDYINGENTFECYWFEQNLIKEHIKNPLCLNRHYVDKDTGNDAWCVAGELKTPEHKERIGAAQRGQKRKPLTPEHLAKISAKLLGKKHSLESVERMKISQRARIISEETKAKMSVGAIKKFSNRTAEERDRIALLQADSLKQNHKTKTPEQKMITKQKKILAFANQSPERKAEINAKRSASAKRRWASQSDNQIHQEEDQ